MKRLALVAALASACVSSAVACSVILVGKDASATGRVLVGHNEDDSGELFVRNGLVPARDHAAGETMPAEKGCAAIPQVAHTCGFFWSEVKGRAGGLSNADAFFNEHGVFVVSDNAATEPFDDAHTALTDGGVYYNLRRAIAERAKSAREAVAVATNLIARWGYAAPRGRIYTVADRDEAWLVQVVHGRNYVAVRCPDDEVTVMPNLYTVSDPGVWPKEDVIASPDLVANARRKGFWDGTGAFDFAGAYQGSYDYGANRAFEHPNNTGRFRQAIRLLTGAEWPAGKPFPFSVRPAKARLSAADVKALLSAHNAPLENGRHVLETWSICSSTTVESTVCEFADVPRACVLHVAPGRPCETPFRTFRPFAEGLPSGFDESATAEARLATHVEPMRRGD